MQVALCISLTVLSLSNFGHTTVTREIFVILPLFSIFSIQFVNIDLLSHTNHFPPTSFSKVISSSYVFYMFPYNILFSIIHTSSVDATPHRLFITLPQCFNTLGLYFLLFYTRPNVLISLGCICAHLPIRPNILMVLGCIWHYFFVIPNNSGFLP